MYNFIYYKMTDSSNTRKSPPLYAPKKSVIPLKKYTKRELPKVEEKTSKVIEIRDESPYPIIGFDRLIVPESKIEYSKKYKSFLCDTEFFRWSHAYHEEILSKIIFTLKFSQYACFLCKLFGNNITLFIARFSEYKDDGVDIKNYKNVLLNRPYNVSISEEYSEIITEHKKMGYYNPVFQYYPILIYEYEDYFAVFYSDEIKTSKTRWSIVLSRIVHQNQGHFTFIFIDHKERIVEFYDPHGRSIKSDLVEFIYESLKKIFVGYKVNEFWKMIGIQYTEILEDEESGFCVIWGMMMIQLKLLNINFSIEQVESLFIEECAKKNLSVYEMMLNYAYTMQRIIPENDKKFITFEKITTSF